MLQTKKVLVVSTTFGRLDQFRPIKSRLQCVVHSIVNATSISRLDKREYNNNKAKLFSPPFI